MTTDPAPGSHPPPVNGTGLPPVPANLSLEEDLPEPPVQPGSLPHGPDSPAHLDTAAPDHPADEPAATPQPEGSTAAADGAATVPPRGAGDVNPGHLTTPETEPADRPSTGDVPASPSAQVRRLSQVLKAVPESERGLILEDYEAALLRGDVTAVPIASSHFALAYRDRESARQRHPSRDEWVIVDERLTAWMEERRAAMRRVLMVVTGEISVGIWTTPDAGTVADLAALRREHLRREAGKAAAKKTRKPA